MSDISDLINNEQNNEIEINFDVFCDVCSKPSEKTYYNKQSKKIRAMCTQNHEILIDGSSLGWLFNG